MSFNSKKLSAFSVFRGRKTSSLSNMSKIDSSPTGTPKPGKVRKVASASTTPTGSRDNSLSSINSKLQSSEKKKQKADMKKLKKILKNSAKGRPSYLPDNAVQSPLADLNSGSVKLKSLRPKGSMANLHYQLPLRANPGIAVSSLSTPESPSMNGDVFVDSVHKKDRSSFQTTPPLPPRNQPSSPNLPPLPPRNGRRSLSPSTTPAAPNIPPRDQPSIKRSTQQEPIKQGSVSPPRKRKRVRLSDPLVTGPSSSQSNKRPAVLSPGARERTEPLPFHPMDRDTGAPYMFDSNMEAAKLFECLIHPVKPAKFFSELWEKKPLLVKRHMPNYNDGWFSTAELDKTLRNHCVNYSDHLDVTSYTNGKRETHNITGRAYAPVVWDYYQNGCSVRILSPQSYSKNTWKLLSILQEYFSSCVGANCYLTPPGTQGFAPHYDDIEAFILQLEGKKHWRLYSPRSDNETLPRYSSNNFTDEDIGEPILDVILEAGDLLYFPRGTIHQGYTLDDAHSLHITISCCQLSSWGDLMEKMLPQALQIAIDEDVEFRQSLPRNYLNTMGVAFSDSESPERKGFLRKIEQLMMKLIPHCPVDAAVDQMGKRFLHDSLPPVLTEAERQCSVHGNGERWDKQHKCIRGAVEIEPDTYVKILRKGCLRLLTEEDKVCIYHNLENSRNRHEVDAQYIEVTAEMAPAVEFLLLSYPEYVKVDDFPLDQVNDKVELAVALYEKGLLVTREPLDHLSESSDSEDDENKD